MKKNIKNMKGASNSASLTDIIIKIEKNNKKNFIKNRFENERN